MRLVKTNFKDLYIIKKKILRDKRGFFFRDFCEKELKKIKFKIKQINFSYNLKKFTLRGFHYQKSPYSENKIITCLNGEIFNVCIDLRKKSKTYLKYFKFKLKAGSNVSLLVPKGFANAYLSLKDNTKILYYMSEFYNPKHSLGFRFNDPYFNVKWPRIPKIIIKKDLKYTNFKL